MKNISKSVSIYMALIILFNINFRSVCVGGNKNNQSSGHGATQKSCNEEKEAPNQREEVEKQPNHEENANNSDIEQSTMFDSQLISANSYVKKRNFYDEDDINGNSKNGGCCKIL